MLFTRARLLTLIGTTASLVGLVALVAPGTLLTVMKSAHTSAAAEVMARTVGVLLLGLGALNLLVRRHPPSPTLRAVLIVDLVVQLGVLPIDPLAFAAGTFGTPGAFVPNTILHLVLATWLIRTLVVWPDQRQTAMPTVKAAV